jgi:hypothetical protein
MSGGGSKPGERRGGRKKGTPNRMTFTKAQMAMKAMSETNWSQKKATLVLNSVMAEAYAMATEYGPGSDQYNEGLYLNFLRLTMAAASRLAPYQDPVLATVKVGGDRDRPLVIREGVTSKRIMEELRQKILETGVLPSGMKVIKSNRIRPDAEQGGGCRRWRSLVIFVTLWGFPASKNYHGVRSRLRKTMGSRLSCHGADLCDGGGVRTARRQVQR